MGTSVFVLLSFFLPAITTLVLVIYGIKKLSNINFRKKVNAESLMLKNINDNQKKVIVSVIVYLFLLILIRELQPEIWDWVWEKELFWLVQLTFLSVALIFSLGPTWTKWLLFPVIIVVLATHVVSEIDKDLSETVIPADTGQRLNFKPLPYTENEIENFLNYQLAPANLRKFERRGRIKNLHKVFSERVDAVNWSSPVVLPTPPSEKILYRLETVVLSGQVLIKNYDTVVGKYPDKDFEILEGKKFSLRFKSIDHLETAVVVWMWEEHLP